MKTQMQHFTEAQKRLFETNEAFMELVNCESNPMTREDLAANIARRPSVWKRFEGFLDVLPSKSGESID